MDNIKGTTHIRLEDIYVDEESNSTLSLSKNSCRSRKSHESHRKVKLEENNNRETLIISQTVKVKKQKIQCITSIDLNKICEHEEGWRAKKRKKKIKHSKKCLKAHTDRDDSISTKIRIKEKQEPRSSPKVNMTSPKKSPEVNLLAKVERIVPHCLRNGCRDALLRKHRAYHLAKKRHKHKKRKHKRVHKRRRSERKRRRSDVSKRQEAYFSPISMSSLKLSPELDNVSSDSFSISPEIDIDTLIQRTRDRERRHNKIFEYKRPRRHLKTPEHCEASDTETVHLRSEGEISTDSVATFILEPQHYPDSDIYSPTQNPENDFDSFEAFCDQENKKYLYSPVMNSLVYERNIKTERDGVSNKFKYEKDDILSVQKISRINSNTNIDSNINTFVKIIELQENEVSAEMGGIEKDLYSCRSPLAIKEEKRSSPICQELAIKEEKRSPPISKDLAIKEEKNSPPICQNLVIKEEKSLSPKRQDLTFTEEKSSSPICQDLAIKEEKSSSPICQDLAIKEEKRSSPICKDYSPKVTDLEINNENLPRKKY